MYIRWLSVLFSVLTLFALAQAFSKEDHEIFRLRDELEASEGDGVSFYDFVGINSDASVKEIAEAFRKRSKTIHPDKVKRNFIASKSVPKARQSGEKRKAAVHVSKGPTQREIDRAYKVATERYQRLGVVVGVLRGPQRERYDHFLRHGFPTWRGTGYYYSRYRPGIGTVILGLFLAGGGAAHYGALVISYNRQREFMEKYIRSARKQAWGDESGVRGIPGVAGPVATPAPEPEEADPTANLNRRQKREMEKQQKKDKAKPTAKTTGTARVVGTGEAAEYGASGQPVGAKKRVLAENGKVLVVDSIGNVFLEVEEEDGQIEHHLLDLAEIPRPTIWDTAVIRLPVWAWRKAFDPFLQSKSRPIVPEAPRRVEYERKRPAPHVEHVDTASLPPPTAQAAIDLSSSQASLGDFELVDSTAVETAPQGGGSGGKKRGKKGKK